MDGGAKPKVSARDGRVEPPCHVFVVHCAAPSTIAADALLLLSPFDAAGRDAEALAQRLLEVKEESREGTGGGGEAAAGESRVSQALRAWQRTVAASSGGDAPTVATPGAPPAVPCAESGLTWPADGTAGNRSALWFGNGHEPAAALEAVMTSLKDARPAFNRARRLVVLPLKAGSSEWDSARVLDAAHRACVGADGTSRAADVVVACGDRATFIVAQHMRGTSHSGSAAAFAGSLSDELKSTAGDIAAGAAEGSLVAFVGAGVSFNAGLPTWGGLLWALAKAAGMADAEAEAMMRLPSFLDRATILEQRLVGAQRDGGDPEGVLGRAVCEQLKCDTLALQHCLIAGIPFRGVVTTNYDTLLERATASADVGLDVLPYEPLRNRGPADRVPRRWLLKMHGCVTAPEDIVLTRADYARYDERRQALAGLLQSQLLTKRLLFVGFSLSDDNFHRILESVRAARRTGGGERAPGASTSTTAAVGGAAGAAGGAGTAEKPWYANERGRDYVLSLGATSKEKKTPDWAVAKQLASVAAEAAAAAAPAAEAGGAASSAFGTALMLQDDALSRELWSGELDLIPMLRDADTPASHGLGVGDLLGRLALQLEVMLDYAGSQAAVAQGRTYVLDAAFKPLWSAEDRALARLLEAWLAGTPQAARRAPGWREVRRAVSLLRHGPPDDVTDDDDWRGAAGGSGGTLSGPPGPPPSTVRGSSSGEVGAAPPLPAATGASTAATRLLLHRQDSTVHVAAPTGQGGDASPCTTPGTPASDDGGGKTEEDGGADGRGASDGLVHVVFGSIVELECDAWLGPTAGSYRLQRYWYPTQPSVASSGAPGTVGDDKGWPSTQGVLCKPPPSDWPTDRPPVIRTRVTKGSRDEWHTVLECVRDFVQYAVAAMTLRGCSPRHGRARFRFALPVVGTGAGGLMHRTGDIVAALLPLLEELAADASLGCPDLVLVCYDEQTFVAAQCARLRSDVWWRRLGLSPHAFRAAQRLASAAQRDRLSVVSGPLLARDVGLPTAGELPGSVLPGLAAQLSAAVSVTSTSTGRRSAASDAYIDRITAALRSTSSRSLPTDVVATLGGVHLSALALRRMHSRDAMLALERATCAHLESDGGVPASEARTRAAQMLRDEVARLLGGGVPGVPSTVLTPLLSPGHMMLASLHALVTATTAQDGLLQRAYALQQVDVAVLPHGRPRSPSTPLLLPLAGTAADRASLVLTRTDAARLQRRSATYAGLLQAQVLMRNTLFACFPESDAVRGRLPHIAAIRRSAESLSGIKGGARGGVSFCAQVPEAAREAEARCTVLTASRDDVLDDVLWSMRAQAVPMAEGRSADGQAEELRRHLAFLDAVSCLVVGRRSSHLLASRYKHALLPGDTLLRECLVQLERTLDEKVPWRRGAEGRVRRERLTPAGAIVEDMLDRLGAGST